jgi:integrase
MGQVDRLPSGRFRGVARIDGKRVSVGTFDYEWEAGGAVEDAERDGIKPRRDEPAAAWTVARYGLHWAALAGGTFATRQTRDRVVRVLQTDPLGMLGVDDVRGDHLQEAIARWQAEGRGAATISQRLRNVQALLNHAVAAEVRRASVSFGRGSTVKPPRMSSQKRGKAMSPAVVGSLIEAAQSIGPEAYARLIIGLDAGLRWGEVAGLRLDSILPAAGENVHGSITVAHVVTREGEHRPSTKTGQPRSVPIRERLAEALRPVVAAARLRSGDDPEALLFVSGNGGPLWYETWHRDEWEPLARAAGLRRRRGKWEHTFHDTRHTFVTELLRAGVPTAVVMQLAGHSTIKMTEAYLSDLGLDGLGAALLAVGAGR